MGSVFVGRLPQDAFAISAVPPREQPDGLARSRSNVSHSVPSVGLADSSAYLPGHDPWNGAPG